MKDFIPKSTDIKNRGLGPKAQRLQALRDKAAAQSDSGKLDAGASAGSAAKARGGVKKPSFNRKAV